jgi:hypothetical protein
MANSATKCPVCGKSVAVGLVSQMIIQHEDKHGARCRGTGQPPVQTAARIAAAAREAAGTTTGSRAKKPATSPATKGGVSVRRVEVDPEALRERQERSERMREERAAAARERNEIHVSYFDEPGR